MSLVESVANVAIGYWVAVGSQCLIFPMFGLYTPLGTNMKMGAWFTVVSLIRSYIVRRIFNKIRPKEKKINNEPITREI